MSQHKPTQPFMDRYHRQYKLGQGGMGQVWKCHDKLLDIEVALKVLIENASDESKRRFQSEAKALAKLKHKNIVGILDFGVSNDGDLYMVMDYIPGQDLKEFIGQKEKLTVHETLMIVSQICDGLRKAHKNNLIHRDIKPSNILLSDENEKQSWVKIVDFGTVRATNVDQFQTPDGSVIGSPLYMSPEAARGEPVDARSDIYSLGCLIFECLSGDVPYRGNTAQQTLMKHVDDPIPDLPLEENEFLKALVRKCLQKNPDDRYQTVDVLLTELIEYFDSLKEVEFEEPKEPLVSMVPKSIMMPIFIVMIVCTLCLGCAFLGVLFASKPIDSEIEMGKTFIMEPETLDFVDKGVNRKPTIKVDSNGMTKCSREITDSDLKNYLVKNEDTGRWNMDHTHVTDAGIKLLDLEKLSFLDIGSTLITNDSIKLIASAKNLTCLDIRNCGEVTLDGARCLTRLQQLMELTIGGKRVNSEWIDVVSSMKNLRGLDCLVELEASDVRKLRVLKKLNRLLLVNPSHEAIMEAIDLPKLDHLIVRGRIDPKSMKVFARSKLRFLDLGKIELAGILPEAYFSKVDGPEQIILPYGTTIKAIEFLNANNPGVKFIKGEDESSF